MVTCFLVTCTLAPGTMSDPQLRSKTDATTQPPIRIKLKQCGAACDKYIVENDDMLPCNSCKCTYHLNCTDFNKEVYQLIKAKNCFGDVNWICSKCKNVDAIPLLEMIKALQQRVSLLETSCKTQPQMTTPKQNNNIPKASTENKITHQLIVSADGNEPLTQKSFAEKVKCNLKTVPIKNLKVAKDGCGIIEFPDQMSRDDGLEKLKVDFNVQPNNRPQRSLLPKITISGLQSSEYLGKDITMLKKAICDKNPSINTLIETGHTFDVLFIKEERRDATMATAVVKVDEKIYDEIRKLNYQLYVDFHRCRVRDRFHLTQCYKCQKFGHMRNNCPIKATDVQVCMYCTGNHVSSSCHHKGDTQHYKCANCGQNHSSTYMKCPFVQNQIDILLNRTQGLEHMAKNDVRPYAIIT